jgi:glycerol-3-phosphate acyltransferase PlsY
MATSIVTSVWSYLFGSIPFGYLLVFVFRGRDVRQTGSGNIGATNVSRTSPALGILTLILDALKGLAAVLITRWVYPGHDLLLGEAALFAIVGHMFPLWLKFRGGKGVATGLGSFAALVPRTILLMIGIFLVLFLVFRYVSLASILTVGLFPLVSWIVEGEREPPQMLAFMAIASLLIIARHHGNIRRLLAHTEPRFQGRRS